MRKKEQTPFPLERDFQAWLVEYLTVRFPKAVIWRHHAASPGRILSRSKKGMADVLMLHKGRMYAFECKAGKATQLASQMNFQLRWTSAGGLYMVAHDSVEVEAQFNEWEI